MNFYSRFIFLFALFIATPAFSIDFRSILGDQTYKVFDCKDRSSNHIQSQCERELIGTAVFKVVKDKSEVFVTYTLAKDSKKVLMELKDCKVVDSKNWICGGKETYSSSNGVSSYMKEYRYQMVDGNVDVSDFYSRISVVGFPPQITVTNGPKFVKN